MSDFPNIDFDSSILDSDKSNVHLRNLKIGSLNLSDYNQRTGANCSSKYSSFKFSPVDNSSKYISNSINTFVSWSRDLDNNKFFDNYINDLRTKFNDIVQPIRSSAHFGKLRQVDIDTFDSRKVEFITLYQNHSPLGFLSDDQSNSIRRESQNLIEELNKER